MQEAWPKVSSLVSNRIALRIGEADIEPIRAPRTRRELKLICVWNGASAPIGQVTLRIVLFVSQSVHGAKMIWTNDERAISGCIIHVCSSMGRDRWTGGCGALAKIAQYSNEEAAGLLTRGIFTICISAAWSKTETAV